MFVKPTSAAALPRSEAASTTVGEEVALVQRVADQSGRELNLANAVKKFDGVSVSAVPEVVEGLATIGRYSELPITLVQSPETYRTVVVEQGSFQSLARKVVPATVVEDTVHKILSGNGSATQTIDLVASTLMRAQRGAILIDRGLLPHSPYANAKDETRRIFSASFYEIRDLLDSRNIQRAQAGERAKHTAFSAGGREGQALFLQGYGAEVQALRVELDTVDRQILPILSAQVQTLHDALRAIDPALPWA